MNVQRSVFEWAAIGLFFVSAGLFVFGVVSKFSKGVDFELLPSPMTFEVRGRDATFVISDCLVNQDLLDDWISSPGGPTISSDTHWPIPGLEMRYSVFANGHHAWYFRLSCWGLLLVTMTMSVLCWRRYLKVRMTPPIHRD